MLSWWKSDEEFDKMFKARFPDYEGPNPNCDLCHGTGITNRRDLTWRDYSASAFSSNMFNMICPCVRPKKNQGA